jgi:hypothetical protein
MTGMAFKRKGIWLKPFVIFLYPALKGRAIDMNLLLSFKVEELLILWFKN